MSKQPPSKKNKNSVSKPRDEQVIFLRVPSTLHERVVEAAKSFDKTRGNNVNRMLNALLRQTYGESKS